MSRAASALFFGLVNLFHPRILWLMIWPMLVALFGWGLVAFFLWGRTTFWIADQLRQWAASGVFFVRFDGGDTMLFVANVLLVLLFVPLVWFTALLILSIFGMQVMVDHVAQRRFPQLARRQGGSTAGGVWNGLLSLAGFAALGLVSIPFWLVPPLWPVIPVAIMGWVNQRLLRYDALAEHATAEEMRDIFAQERKTLYILGALLALLAFVPFVGLIAPALFALAFIHYLLAALSAVRGAPVEGVVIEGRIGPG